MTNYAPAVVHANGPQNPTRSKAALPLSVSSANGVAAVTQAVQEMKNGADTLDAVIAGVNIVELDPNDNSVGRFHSLER